MTYNKYNNLTIEEIKTKLQNTRYFYSNLNVSIFDITKNVDKLSTCNVNLHLNDLIKRPDMTLDIIDKYLQHIQLAYNKSWEMDHIHYNKKITIDYIKKNIHFDWDWHQLSKVISFKDILANPDLPWQYQYIDQNPDITPEFLIKQEWMSSDKWQTVSMLSDIEYILQNQHLPWSWPCVSGYNQSLTIQHIIDNPQIEWNFSMYSRNNLAFNQCNKYNIKHYHNNYYNRYYHNKIKEYIKSTNFIITDLTIIICQYFEYNVSV